jgi:uncharacterized protein YicC (UPF0701 family)
VFVEELEPMERTVKVNMPLLRGYLQALEQVQSELPVKQDLTIDHVLTLPVFEQEDPAVDWENLALLTEEAVTAAIGELEQMRALEGAQLHRGFGREVRLREPDWWIPSRRQPLTWWKHTGPGSESASRSSWMGQASPKNAS